MDEQNVKPKRKQNIIRFPSSKWERRRILRESKDVRVRAIVMLRLVCGWRCGRTAADVAANSPFASHSTAFSNRSGR